MILLVIVIFTILVLMTWMYISNRALRNVLGSVSLIALIASVGLLTMHFDSHLGMKKITKTKTEVIYSSAGNSIPAGVLVAQRLGTKADNYVFVYADKENGKAVPHFKPDKADMAEATKKTATYKLTATDKPLVVTKTTKWVYKNDVFKWLFDVNGHSSELVSQKVTALLPEKTWVILTAEQAKQLSQGGMMGNDAQAAIKNEVQQQVMSYMVAHPDASNDQITTVTNTATAEATANLIKSAVK